MNDEAIISYILRYGGRCRDCGDSDGICSVTGVPCDPEIERAVVIKCLTALRYGVRHGYIENPLKEF